MPSHDRNRRRELWRKQARERDAERAHILGRIAELRAAALASVKVVYDRDAGIGQIPPNLAARIEVDGGCNPQFVVHRCWRDWSARQPGGLSR